MICLVIPSGTKRAFVCFIVEQHLKETEMSKDKKKESKGKPKKDTAKASVPTSGTGLIATSAPGGKPGANVKPTPGAKR